MRRTFLSLILFSALVSTGFPQTTVTGRVTGGEGRPLVKANILLRTPFDTTVAGEVQAGPDGRFVVKVPSAGVWMLVARGVHHADHIVALYVTGENRINVDIRLGAYDYLKSFADVRAIGSFNNWYRFSGVPLRKQPDGTYTTDIKTKRPSVSYRLLGVREGGGIEGTQPAGYVYNRSRGYETVIRSTGGAAKIVFNPGQLVRSPAKARVRFVNTPRRISRFDEIYAERARFEEAFRKSFRAHMDSRMRNPEAFGFDFSSDISGIKKQLGSEKDPVLRSELYLNYLRIYVMSRKIDPSFYADVLREIPPGSAVWSLAPNSVFFALSHSDLSDAQQDDYVNRLVTENPVRRVKSIVLFDEFMGSKMKEDKARTSRYYTMLVNDFGDTPEAEHVSRVFTNPSALETGRPAPSFAVHSSDNMVRLITNKSLHGDYYLIYFWAAEDPQSAGNMKYLHEAFDRYNKKNFQILTISVDSSYADVVKFRKEKWDMPWLNAYVGRNRDDKLVKAFHAYDIPKAYLVDPNGILIAEGSELVGTRLERTLARVLGD